MKITLMVRMHFEIPDGTSLENLSVEFPGGNPIIGDIDHPVSGSTFQGHATESIDTDENEWEGPVAT